MNIPNVFFGVLSFGYGFSATYHIRYIVFGITVIAFERKYNYNNYRRNKQNRKKNNANVIFRFSIRIVFQLDSLLSNFYNKKIILSADKISVGKMIFSFLKFYKKGSDQSAQPV